MTSTIMQAQRPACPMCGAGEGVRSIDDFVRHHRIKGHPEAILRAVWASSGQIMTTERLFDALYADDPDGGPSRTKMHADLHAAVRTVNTMLAGTLRVEQVGAKRGRWRLRITP